MSIPSRLMLLVVLLSLLGGSLACLDDDLIVVIGDSEPQTDDTDSDSESETGPDGGLCCLCRVPGAPPALCGPPFPVVNESDCDDLSQDFAAGWSEWHDECDPDDWDPNMPESCPGVCGLE